jgi:hypothetical protein
MIHSTPVAATLTMLGVFRQVEEAAVAITTAEIDQMILDRGLGLPTSPKRENYPTQEAWEEAATGWNHRVAKAVLPIMSHWKASQEKSKSKD